MSDPVTNLDIEDVLASIRRLVSHGERTPVRPPEKERLILTPQQRVDETPSDEMGGPIDLGSPEPAFSNDVAQHDDIRDADVEMSVEEPVDQSLLSAIAALAEGHAPSSEPVDEAAVEESEALDALYADGEAANDAASLDADDFQDVVADEASAAVPFELRAANTDDAASAEAVIEEAVSTSADEGVDEPSSAAPFVLHGSFMSRAPDTEESGADIDDAAQFDGEEEMPEDMNARSFDDAEYAPEPAQEVAQSAHPAFAVLDSDRSRLEATIAELEAAVTGVDGDFEPDGTEGDVDLDWEDAGTATAAFVSRRGLAPAQPEEVDPAVETLEVLEPADMNQAAPASIQPKEGADTVIDHSSDEHAVEDAGQQPELQPAPEVVEQSRPSAPHLAVVQAEVMDDEDETTAIASEEAYWDEDALRHLVAEVLREELQGELGERITRNVRKLVRREIHKMIGAPE